MVDRKYCVYCHTTPSGKRYVGITCQRPSHRWNNGKGYSQNKHFYNAILKYGWENIEHTLLYEGLSMDDACEKEISLIEQFKSNNPKYGYNQSVGGESGYAGCSWSENRRILTSRRMIGDKRCLGYKHTPETREKMSKAQLCRKHAPLTDEQKVKCIANLPKPRYGSDNPTSKAVICVETQRIYPSGEEAARQMGLQKAHISQVCNGKRNTTGGYHFLFYENEEVFSH